MDSDHRKSLTRLSSRALPTLPSWAHQWLSLPVPVNLNQVNSTQESRPGLQACRFLVPDSSAAHRILSPGVCIVLSVSTG